MDPRPSAELGTRGQVSQSLPLHALRSTFSMQRRVEFAALLQFASHGIARRSTTAAACPGTGSSDLEAALNYLIGEGSIIADDARLDSVIAQSEGGWLTLTGVGQQRLDDCDL